MWLTRGPARTKYNQSLRPVLDELFKSIEPPQGAPFVVKPYMIGRDEEGRTANPRVTLCCPLPKVCKEAMAALQESGCLERPELSGFGMGYATVPLESQSQDPNVRLRLLQDETQSTSVTEGDCTSKIHVFGTPDQRMGRKLRFHHRTDTTHETREATGGPIIRLGNDLYQLTVAHAAQPSTRTAMSDDGEASSNSYWFQERSMDDSQIDNDSWDDDELALSIASRSSQGSLTRDEDALSDDQAISSPSNASGSSRAATTFSRSLEDQPNIAQESVTMHQQLQIPEEDAYEFLLSIPGPLAREVTLDYILLKLQPDENSNLRNETVCTKHGASLQVCEVGVIDDDMDSAHILVVTSHGMISGKIYYDSSLIKFPGSQNFQNTLLAVLYGQVTKGDSGSAVIGARTGDFYGHAVIGTNPGSIVYVVPAVDIFNDIRANFAETPDLYLARMSLPSSENATSSSRASDVSAPGSQRPSPPFPVSLTSDEIHVRPTEPRIDRYEGSHLQGHLPLDSRVGPMQRQLAHWQLDQYGQSLPDLGPTPPLERHWPRQQRLRADFHKRSASDAKLPSAKSPVDLTIPRYL